MKLALRNAWVAGFFVLSAQLARAGDTALDVKASGAKKFYCDSRAGNSQVSIFSQSTLEDFTTVCNQVQGECALDPRALEQLRGRFALKVDDLHTGIELRDTHLRGPEWLDEAKYPDVVITVEQIEQVKKTESSTATMTMVGKCSLHGKTNPVKIACTLTYLDESPTTMKRVKGDLLRLRAEFSIKLSDFDIKGASGAIGLKVSDELPIKATVYGSTEPPAAPLKTDKDTSGAAPAKPRPPAEPAKP